MSTPALMKCGHTANGIVGGDTPCCVICYGIVGDDAITPVEDPPNLFGREAKCSSCGRTVPSDFSLAFFRHQPEAEFDSYYSGCRGWD